jgi:transcriptional regulator with XRE-family HTH domain
MDSVRSRKRPSKTRRGASVHRIRERLRTSVVSYGVHVRTNDRPATGPDGQPSAWVRYLQELTSRPGWSASRLARESGVNRSSIYRWLHGRVDNVSANSVRAIARAVGDSEDEALATAADAINRTTATEQKESIDEWEARRRAEIWGDPMLTDDDKRDLEARLKETAQALRAAEAEKRALDERVRFLHDRRTA